jgi:lysophospholipase L1-like esterase
MKRFVLALVVAALTLIAAEGVLRLGFDRSLFGASEPAHPQRPPPPDPTEPGLYVAHPDPRVGYVLRPDADLAIFDGTIRSNEEGMRQRVGPLRSFVPLRVVVLGDSVAFGYGLDDDQTIAHVLERELLAAVPHSGYPPHCRTIAAPGWNHRNAVEFLLANLDELEPDIVLYMPIANDLFDTDGVREDGRRRAARDPDSPEPELAVDQLAGFRFAQDARERLHAEGRDDVGAWMGPPALLADLTPGSSDRYEQNVDSIERLADAIEALPGLMAPKAHLALLQYKDEAYAWNIQRRLAERGRSIPVIPLFKSVPDELTLGYDPHPNAEGAALMARWIAGELLLSGWLPTGEDEKGLALADERADLRAEARSPEDVALAADVARTGQWQRLRTTIDWETLEGVAQILGGVNADGSVGTRALLMLGRGGSELVVELARIEGRDDINQLEVVVEVDGQRVGTITIDGAGPATGRFAVPPPAGPHAEPLEVRLIPERWVEEPVPGGNSQSVSFRPLRVSCPPD